MLHIDFRLEQNLQYEKVNFGQQIADPDWKYFSKSFCKIKINMELLFTFEMENVFPDKHHI